MRGANIRGRRDRWVQTERILSGMVALGKGRGEGMEKRKKNGKEGRGTRRKRRGKGCGDGVRGAMKADGVLRRHSDTAGR